jgi:OOP family OmpA-OmpF porin
VVLEGLAFATGSAELAPGGDSILGALAAYLLANPTRRVALVGHTDAQGALEANIALSRRRAQAVTDRLTSAFGVPRTQVEAEGMGWLAPIATNLTPEGRVANRRVEAVVLP